MTPPASEAKRATRASNSSSNNETRSDGYAPMTGGNNDERYDRNISGSKADIGSGSWWLTDPLAGASKLDESMSRKNVSDTDLIEFRVEFDLLQRLKGALSERLGSGFR